VADIFRRHGPAYRRDRQGSLGRVETRVMRAIELCRTAALGGHLEACGNCSHTRIAYNSCRNRHCPKCQGSAREAWLAPAPGWLSGFCVRHDGTGAAEGGLGGACFS
jgi:hypothetical protein